MDQIQDDLNPNLLQNMIRQRSVMSALNPPEQTAPEMMKSQPDFGSLGRAPDFHVAVSHHSGFGGDIVPQDIPQVPKVGPIDPSSAQPAESAYKQALMNEPMHADYHPSVGRKIAGTLAGIGAGILGGGVEGGIKVGDQVRDAPFNSQHQDWSQFAGNREKLATEEAYGTETSSKEALRQAQIGEQNSLAGLHGNQSNKTVRELQLMRNTPEEVKQDKIDEAQGRLKVDTREAKMLDGSVRHLVQRNGLFYDPLTNERVDRAAIEDISDEGKSLKETKDARIPGNLGARIKAKKIIAAGVGGKTDDGIKVDQATFDSAKEFDADLSAGKDPSGAFARIIQLRNKERVAAGKPEMSSDEAEALEMKILSVQKPPQSLMIGPDNTAINVRPGTKVPEGAQTPSGVNAENTATAATRTRGEASQTAIESGKSVIEFINQNKAKLGNVGNYWNNLMQNTPAADPTVEAFRGHVASWAAQQAAAHGFRASTVMREFESRVGTTKNPDAVIAAIQGINEELEHAVNIAKGSGRTPSDQLPGGVSLSDIDAEIARRKGKK